FKLPAWFPTLRDARFGALLRVRRVNSRAMKARHGVTPPATELAALRPNRFASPTPPAILRLTVPCGVAMSLFPSFAADYSGARETCLAAARIAGATRARYDTPTKGPGGEALSTDVAWLGPDDAAKVVVTISSTHGVEGFCGSGFQVDWLARKGVAALPRGTA